MPTEEPKPASTEHSGTPEAPSGPAARPPRKRRTRMVVVLALLAVAILFVAVPRIIRALNTVSTDDGYVNGYVTFVGPRVAGQGAVDAAQADLVVTEANVRGSVAQVRRQRFKLSRAIEDVDNQIALIRAR